MGSSAYPNYCSFGKYLNGIMEELGGTRIMDIVCGDELAGQEKAFRKWAPNVFMVLFIFFYLLYYIYKTFYLLFLIFMRIFLIIYIIKK